MSCPQDCFGMLHATIADSTAGLFDQTGPCTSYDERMRLYIDNSIDQSGHGWYVREKKQTEHVLDTNHLVSANQSGRRCSSPTIDAGEAGGFPGSCFSRQAEEEKKKPEPPPDPPICPHRAKTFLCVPLAPRSSHRL